jgi:hypothetical protein
MEMPRRYGESLAAHTAMPIQATAVVTDRATATFRNKWVIGGITF